MRMEWNYEVSSCSILKVRDQAIIAISWRETKQVEARRRRRRRRRLR